MFVYNKIIIIANPQEAQVVRPILDILDLDYKENSEGVFEVVTSEGERWETI